MGLPQPEDTETPLERLTLDEAREEIRALPESKVEYIRNRAKTDLAFLSNGILGYKDVNPRTHGALCKYIVQDSSLRRLALMPRGHLKSTIATISDSVRLALVDPDECRILIVNETATNAEGFLSEIKGHFTDNELLRRFFPSVIPTKLVGPGSQWGAAMASVNRGLSYKEPTWTAIGLGGAVTSRHYSRIKADDLIGLEANRSAAVMAAAIKWVGNIEALIINANEDIIDFIGTRWSRHDLYAHVMRTYGRRLSVFRRKPIENDEVVFPAKFNMQFFADLRAADPEVWYSQYENDPISGGVRDLASPKAYVYDNQGYILYTNLEGRKARVSPWALDRVVVVDVSLGGSASSDFSAICVVGTAPDSCSFVLSSRANRWNPSDLVDEIVVDIIKWRPRVVGVEKAGLASTQHYLQKEVNEKKLLVSVVPVSHKNQPKDERIRAKLQPVLKSGRLYTLKSQLSLNSAINNFPDLQYWDEIDTLAYYVDIAITPATQAEMEEEAAAETKVLQFRGASGYAIG